MDEVRALVDAVHEKLNVQSPMDEWFLNLLGTGKLSGRLPRYMRHVRHVRLVILGAYKIRQPHRDALAYLAANGSEMTKRLAVVATDIDDRSIDADVDVLAPEIRGGTWFWRNSAMLTCPEARMQEHRAWAHLGATPRDLSGDLCKAERALAHLEEKHGCAEPLQWRWGEGHACSNVFEVDVAMREHAHLLSEIHALRRCTAAEAAVAPPLAAELPREVLTAPAGRSRREAERSRSPVR